MKIEKFSTMSPIQTPTDTPGSPSLPHRFHPFPHTPSSNNHPQPIAAPHVNQAPRHAPPPYSFHHGPSHHAQNFQDRNSSTCKPTMQQPIVPQIPHSQPSPMNHPNLCPKTQQNKSVEKPDPSNSSEKRQSTDEDVDEGVIFLSEQKPSPSKTQTPNSVSGTLSNAKRKEEEAKAINERNIGKVRQATSFLEQLIKDEYYSDEDMDSEEDFSGKSESKTSPSKSGSSSSGSEQSNKHGKIGDKIQSSSSKSESGTSSGRKRARSPSHVARLKRCRRMKANDRERNR